MPFAAPLRVLSRSVTEVAPDSSVIAPAMATPSVESGTSIPAEAYACFFRAKSAASFSAERSSRLNPRTSTFAAPLSVKALPMKRPCPPLQTSAPYRRCPQILFDSTAGAPPSRTTTPSVLPLISLSTTFPFAFGPLTYTPAVCLSWMRFPFTRGFPSVPMLTPTPVLLLMSFSRSWKRTSTDSRLAPPPPWQWTPPNLESRIVLRSMQGKALRFTSIFQER
mmetsp:Transcript_46412/g.100821  ORF Transcript_46412/g.100821 Transcript_46412/m.100821 type:complete len:222 (-) Transcript_46412:393-1058(-)